MATLINDRNELLYSASSRVTGSTVTISAGVATSLVVPKNATVIVPSSLTLQANTIGYVTPVFVWSYRFGNTGNFTSIINNTSNTVIFSCDAAFLTAAGTSTLVQFKVDVIETKSNLGVNGSSYILALPILREGTNGTSGINNVTVILYKRTATNIAPVFTDTDKIANSTYTFSTAQVVGQPAAWTQAIPSSSSGAYLWTTQVLAVSITASYIFANTQWSTPVLYSQDGISSLIYDITTSSAVITKNAKDADTDGVYSSITIYGKKYEGSTTSSYGYLTITGNGSIEDTIALGNTVLFTPLSTAGKSSYTIRLYNQSTVLGATLLDTQNIYVVYKGADGTSGLSVILSNESFVFPATTAGAVNSYVNSGTDIRVYEGATEVVYDGIGNTKNTWKISAISSNITVGTITDNGTYITIGPHNSVTDSIDTSTITYTITGVNSDNIPFTFTKTQTFSKSKAGVSGTNTAIIYAYQRSSSTITSNPGNVDYSFSTNSISTLTLLNNWQKTIPAGIDPLYITAATAASITNTDNILASEWAAPIIFVQNGVSGQDGINLNAILNYDFAGSTLPTNVTFPGTIATSDNDTATIITNTVQDQNLRFANLALVPNNSYIISMRVKLISGAWEGMIFPTNTLHGENGGYFKTIPAPALGVWTTINVDMRTLSNGGTDYMSGGTISGLRFDFINAVGASVAIDYISIGKYGIAESIPGQDGYNSATIYLYARNNNSSTAPTLNSANSINYTFSTGVVSGSLPTNWSTVLQADSVGSVVWIVQATAFSRSSNVDINNTKWSTPRVLAQIGANGVRGSRQLYSSDVLYTSIYTLAPNAIGAASYATKATLLIAAATANSIPTTPINGDTVTFSNGSDYVYTITYNASNNWVTPGTIIDGNLLVTGTVTASKINSNGLEVKKPDGTVMLSSSIKLGSTYIDKIEADQIKAGTIQVGLVIKSIDGLFVIDFANKYIKINS